MPEPNLWRYLATALTTPLLVPLALVLLPWWRCAFRRVCLLALALEGVLAAVGALLYLAFGPSPQGIWAAGVFLPLICVLAFVHLCELRDGRLLFLMVSMALYNAVCDSLVGMFAPRSDPLWLALKVISTAVLGTLLALFARRPLLEMLDSNQIHWGQVSVIPLALHAGLLSLYLPRIEMGQRTPPSSTIILCLSAVLVYITLYRFQRATLEQTEIRQSAELLRSQVDFLHRQAALAEQASENMRVFRHDIRHYITLLQGCLDAGETGAAREVLEQMRRNAEAGDGWAALRRYTGLPVLDTVLTQAAEQAQRAGVEFTARLALPAELRVDCTELAVAISNALENAVNAAGREPDTARRAVSIESRPCDEQLFLVVTNTYSGALEKDEKTGLPRAERAGHGYGTRSIANFARKYGCQVDCCVRDGAFSLRLLI